MTKPDTSAVNFIPSSTFAPASPPSAEPAGAAAPNNVWEAAALGVAAFDGDEPAPVPPPFVAETTNVYAVPFVSPGTTVAVAGGAPFTVVVAWATTPMNGVTVYEVIALPLSAGATQLTITEESAAEAETPEGASGGESAAAVCVARGEPSHTDTIATDAMTLVIRNRRLRAQLPQRLHECAHDLPPPAGAERSLRTLATPAQTSLTSISLSVVDSKSP